MVSRDAKPQEKEEEKKQLGRILLKRRPAAEIRALASQEPREPNVSRRPLDASGPAPALSDERHAELVQLSERFGVPALDLLQLCLSTSDLEAVPKDMAEQHVLVPVLVRADRLFVAMKDPSRQDVIREIEFLSGKRVYAYAAKEEEIVTVIALGYQCKRQGDSHYVGPSCPPETLRKAGLPPDRARSMPSLTELGPSREAPVIIPAPPLMPSLEPGPALIAEVEPRALAVDFEPPPFGELLANADAALPGTVSAYPPRASSLPPALRRHASEPSDDPRELIAEMEDAFEQLTDEPSVVAPLPREAGSVSSALGKTVLVVDDSEDVRDLLKRALTDEGYEVVLAENGQRALQLIKESRPDLILLDAMLPEVHGFEIARRLRKSKRYGDVPIVMVSAVYRGWRFAEDLRESCGIEHYIEKPFRLADVKRAVQLALLARPDTPEAALTSSAKEGSAQAEDALKQGVEAFQRGETAIAIQHLERGIAIDPLAFRLHFHLGLLYAKEGRTFEAISALERAVEINSRHFAGVKNLAIMYYQVGFRHRAAELWERGLNLAPDEATRNAIKEHLVGLLS